jgi:hypothetical protein
MNHGAALKVPRWLLRVFLGGLGMALIVPSISLAGVAVCQPPSDFSRAAVAYYDYDESALSGGTGKVRRKNHDIDLHYEQGETWSFGAGHRYVILDMDPVELQTNGHLHTVFFPVHRQNRSDGKNFRFSIAPALSASSNVMKDPGEYSADTVQLLAALVWTREISDQVDLRYGACGDHRFGQYKIYPAVSIAWRPHPAVLFELGFPATRLSYQATPDVNLSLGIAPDGNEWHVKSKDLEKQSQLVHESTLVEWTLGWRPIADLVVTVAVGRAFDNRYDVTLLDDRRVDLTGDAVTRVGATLEWRF